jgi:hypothetical protein
VKKDFTMPSLLPYLQPDANNFGLEISTVSTAPSAAQRPAYPFLQIGDAGPFARLLEGKVVTDSGSIIKRVFLLQQSDDYFWPNDEVWSFTNSDLDRLWMQAFSKYSGQSQETSGDGSPLLLSGQINESDDIVPFQPLFYCIHKNVYFHSVCPQCCNYLDLCKDDDLLAELELSAYATSLKRYLYCPECVRGPGQSDFYTTNRAASDPPSVKDPSTLISEIGNLVANRGSLNQFPCSDCPERSQCYGNDNLAVTRIVPYSFYPFHLLIFDADALNAVDFLAYLSGATLNELQDHLTRKQALGRLSCLKALQQRITGHSSYIFHQGNDKNFLEVLFLKLSFLGELIQQILSDDNALTWPDFSFSLDRVWVKLVDQTDLLPSLWNYNLRILDLGFHAAGTPHLSKYPPAYGLHFLGNVWFYVLLVNTRQPVEPVRTHLEKFLTRPPPEDKSLTDFAQNNDLEPIFAPENIYWNPQGKRINQNWLEIWKNALDLGGSLLVAGMNQETRWSADSFWQYFEALRENIKTELFGSSPVLFQEESQADDQLISTILSRLLKKWRSELRQKPIEPSPEMDSPPVVHAEPAEAEMPETVILSPNEAAKTIISSSQPVDEEETLILPPKSTPAGKQIDREPDDEDLVQETVILSSGEGEMKSLHTEPTGFTAAESDLAETLILSPSENHRRDLETDQTPDSSARSADDPRDSELEKDRNKEKSKAKIKKNDTLDDDDLAETVILRSDIGKDNNSTHE